MRITGIVISLVVIAIPSAWSQKASTPIYRDAAAPISDRVRDLLGKMTIDEKVAQLESGINLGSLAGPGSRPALLDKGALNADLAKQSLANGLGTYAFLDEFFGLAKGALDAATNRNLLQAWVLRNTRLGIPIMFHAEALHGYVLKGATSFPQAIALGSTWDPDLITAMFTAVAKEARSTGNALVLAPVLDLSRDPRYGRAEEMYSEDPYLVARLGTAAVRGLQGDSSLIDQEHVFATAKHFVHGQPENGTNAGPSDFSERTMRSIFLYPFQEVIQKAHIGAVMPSYNENNGGIPSSENSWLLKQVLRNEWNFPGLTVSDYFAVEQLAILQHVAADAASAGVLAFKSGVDMELPTTAGYPALVAAVRSGEISEQDLNLAVERVLTAKFRAGLFEHPYADPKRAAELVGSKRNIDLARKVADEAIVLLKNRNNILPLDPARIKTIAVIGPNAVKMRLGTYSGVPSYYVSVLDGIRNRVGKGVTVIHAEGCRISEPDEAPNLNDLVTYKAPDEETEKRLIKEAVAAAASADVIVLALGGNEAVSRESIVDLGLSAYGDSDSLELPGMQNELVGEIAKLGKPVVAVVLNGKPYSLEKLSQQVPGIIEGWYLGQETGNAISGVLFGDTNPSGHLPVTIARNVGQLPVYYYKTSAARRGYVFHENTPLYPFGFGLHYTTFSFGAPSIDRKTISGSEKARVSVNVTNSGSRPGDEIVQMYVHHPVSSVVQPVIALRAFKRIHLAAGEIATVTFEVGADELSILNKDMKRVVEPGNVDILVGANAAETESVQVTVSE